MITGLAVYASKDKKICVILARGHKRSKTRMILWNVELDTFEKGQWLTKKHVKLGKCGISPDGKEFQFLYGGSDNFYYFGVCVPPRFTVSHSFKIGNSYDTFPYFTDEGKLSRTGFEYKSLVLRPKQSKDKYDIINYVAPKSTEPDAKGNYVCECGKTLKFTGMKYHNLSLYHMDHERRIRSKKNDQLIAKQMQTPTEWVDYKERTITTEGGILYADGEVLEDFTDDTFSFVV